MKTLEWRKPTIAFYRERLDKPEIEPFAVVKAQRISIQIEEKEFNGSLRDFFALMGDIDYISSAGGKDERYILCWFDDSEENFKKASRKLSGVTFSPGLSFTTSEGKRTYNASFQAKQAKLS